MLALRNTIVAGTSALALLALSACGSDTPETAARTPGGADGEATGAPAELDTVTVQLDYQIRGNHGMFFVADELGYFEEEGIEVEAINVGSGSPDALRLVGDGGADFGFADLPSLVTARSQDVPVKALAAVNQVSPLGMCTLSDNVELDGVDDLVGLTVGVHPAGSTYIFYQALLAANDLERTDMTEVTVTPPYENYLLQGQVDAVICYVDAEVPLLEDKAGGEGSLSILPGSESGYDAYGSGLFTTDEMIESDPDLVQRFANAYLRAFEYVVENPEETAELLAASAPELASNAEVFTRQLQADIDHTFTSEVAEAGGLGTMDEEMWQSTIDILADQGVLEGEPPATEEVYDPTFVEAYNDSSN